MTPPVDLTNFREMTGGDAELEKILFGEFCSSFENGLTDLQTHCRDNAAEPWRKCAHALKGICLNLGAHGLSDLCKTAQESPQADTETKLALLAKIQEEYKRVQKFVTGLAAN